MLKECKSLHWTFANWAASFLEVSFFGSILKWQKVEKAGSQRASKDNTLVIKYKSDNLAVEVKSEKTDLVAMAEERITKFRNLEIF